MQKHFIKIHKQAFHQNPQAGALWLLNHPPFMEEKLGAWRCPPTCLHYKIWTRSSLLKSSVGRETQIQNCTGFEINLKNPHSGITQVTGGAAGFHQICLNFVFWEPEPKGFSLDTGYHTTRRTRVAAWEGSGYLESHSHWERFFGQHRGCSDHRVRTCWTKLAIRNLVPGQ